jgi:uncharacterized repeat protein (TIGR04138 family)
MPGEIDFWEAVRRIRKADDSFQPNVYPFLLEALEFTIAGVGERRHVHATELLSGFSAYARTRFGFLATDVLDKWGVSCSFDVGLVVFQMIDAGILARQDTDKLEDFSNGFDLRQSLAEGYLD